MTQPAASNKPNPERENPGIKPGQSQRSGAGEETDQGRAKDGRIQEIGDESRRRILDAAESLFAEQGYVETSLVQVAESAGISRGSIPWHFKNKDGLLMAVVERAAGRGRTMVGFGGSGGVEETLADVANLMRQPHMALLHTLLGQASKPDSDIHDAYVGMHEHDRQAIQSWLELAPDFAIPGLDAKQQSFLMYALMVGIHVQWRVAPDSVDLDESMALVAAFLRARSTQDKPKA